MIVDVECFILLACIMRIKVAIVEDDLQTRESLKLMAESSDEIICKELFESAEDFSARLKHLDVDVVLMDINLPGNSGIECVEKAATIRTDVQFLMCTHLEDTDKICAALSVGATGYIIKNTTPKKLVEAIKEIYTGGSPMSPQIARKVTETFARDRKHLNQFESLSKREKEIMELIELGYQYKLVADRLKISIETVRTNIRDIYKKLQVHNKTEAINKLFAKTRK